MGASAQRPTANKPGSGGSGFYQNALNQQKQAVASASSIQGKQPSDMGEDSRYLNAYNTYMQRQGGGQYPPTQGSPFGQSQPQVSQQQQPQVSPSPEQNQRSMRRRPMDEERPPASSKGITMGAGYANRPLN
jgi:hypothetical protein